MCWPNLLRQYLLTLIHVKSLGEYGNFSDLENELDSGGRHCILNNSLGIFFLLQIVMPSLPIFFFNGHVMRTGWVFPGHLQPAHGDGALCVLCGYSEDVNYVTGLAPCMSSQAQPQKKMNTDGRFWSAHSLGRTFLYLPETLPVSPVKHFHCKLFRGVSALSKIDSAWKEKYQQEIQINRLYT